jgi:hypothetical protein
MIVNSYLTEVGNAEDEKRGTEDLHFHPVTGLVRIIG